MRGAILLIGPETRKAMCALLKKTPRDAEAKLTLTSAEQSLEVPGQPKLDLSMLEVDTPNLKRRLGI
jgi:hypothetical protein